MGWIRLIRMVGVGMVLMVSAIGVRAQTWAEWFSQNKTQQKYLIEQVAALKFYAGYLKKGYEIGSSGLNFIKGATKGEFDQHNAFFSSLKSVNPEVKKDVRIAEIIQMQVLIGKAFSSLKPSDGLSIGSLDYVQLVKENLLSECVADLEELVLIITSGKVEMGDEERIIRVDKLYQSMLAKKIFALRFAGAAKSLANNRKKELKSLMEMEVWFEYD